MKTLLAALLLLPLAGLSQTNLETVFTHPDFWAKGLEPFSARLQEARFQWTSAQKECLRTTADGVGFTGLAAVETLIWLKSGRPSEVTLSLFNRGDCPPIDKPAFLELLKGAQRNLAALPQATASATGPALFQGFPPKRQVWRVRDLALVMEWDSSQKTDEDTYFQAEYARVRILPAAQAAGGAADRPVSAFAAGQKKVSTNDKGDCFLADVPMVDQGPKGYCAVATTERVMRYYGASFDQHQLAQAADTQEGTDPASLAKALSRLSTRLRVSVNVLEEFSVQEFLKLIRTYNTGAKKAGKMEIELPKTGVIDIGQIYGEMDPAILLEARTRNPTGVNRFADRIKQNIQARTPLIWGVMLGLVPEANLPQARGGHLRLIIGYNEKTRELLYSDSWGAGHELKRMPLTEAYAITTSLFALKPK